MHRMTNKLFVDMQHRCVARPAAEEWNLAVYRHNHDVTNAEYIRTDRSVDFPGGQYLKREEDEQARSTDRPVIKLLAAPRKLEGHTTDDIVLKHWPDLYGFRGHLPEYADVYYLNPWEFQMLWEVCRLPAPAKATKDFSAEQSTTSSPPPPLSVLTGKRPRHLSRKAFCIMC